MSLYVKRGIATTLFVLVAIGVPILLFTLKYPKLWDLTRDIVWKLGGFAIIVSLSLTFVFRKFIKKRLQALQYGWFKVTLTVVGAALPAWIFLGIIWSVNRYIDTLYYIISVVAITETVAWVVIYPFIMHWDFVIQREKRKQETIEALRESR